MTKLVTAAALSNFSAQIDVNKPRKPRKAEPSRPNQRMAQPWIGATCTSGQISMANQTVKPTQIARVMDAPIRARSDEHTSELQSLMRISYAVFCFQKKT